MSCENGFLSLDGGLDMERQIYRRQVTKIQNYICLVDFFVVGKGGESLASSCRIGHVGEMETSHWTRRSQF